MRSSSAHATAVGAVVPALLRYAGAVLAVAVALGVSLLVQPLDGPPAYLLFFAAVLVSARYGRLGPSVLAIVLSVVALDYFFLPPIYSLGMSVTDAVGVAVFVLLALLVHSLHARQLQLERTAAENQREWQIARQIQQQLFPNATPRIAGFDLAGACRPANATGGDFFDFIPMRGECLGIAVGDVSGHGFGPALLMAEMHGILRSLALVDRDVGEMLTLANRLIESDMNDGKFVTLFLGRLNPIQRTFEYAGAGHEGYLLSASGEITTLRSTGLPLGILETAVIHGCSLRLEPDQCVLVMTDGMVEAKSRDGQVFGVDGALDVARAHHSQSAQQIVEALCEAVERFSQGAPQNDDLTAVVIKT